MNDYHSCVSFFKILSLKEKNVTPGLFCFRIPELYEFEYAI